MVGDEARIHVGTSGWSYRHWRGTFYAPGTRPADEFAFYARHFSTVEINASFYRLPETTTFAAWRDAAPPGFVFAVKASRYITHMKKLRDTEQAVALLLKRAEVLHDRLGPILFQLPPRWRKNTDRLRDFVVQLPRGYRYVFEFRDPSWFADDVYDLLRERDIGFCIYDLAGRATPLVTMSGLVYIRLHKPAGEGWRYDRATLATWADRMRAWRDAGHTVWCYFNNDPDTAAPRNAHELIDFLGPTTARTEPASP